MVYLIIEYNSNFYLFVSLFPNNPEPPHRGRKDTEQMSVLMSLLKDYNEIILEPLLLHLLTYPHVRYSSSWMDENI